MRRDAWRLPDGIDEVLPPDAWALEQLRRRVLDLFDRWGYEYVMPPLVEYLDALLVGSGSDLELQTFRMVDQRSGRMLGIRADMTSQAARIDASSARRGTRRICYAGTVVHANPSGVLASRVPLLAGAELFGAEGVDADAEVVALMAAVLACAGIADPVIELGHVGVFRSFAEGDRLAGLERELFEALQRKSESDIAALVAETKLTRAQREFLSVLPRQMGGIEVIAEARRHRGLMRTTETALDDLERLAGALASRCPQLRLRFDLSELTGYGYHTGPVFTAYSGDLGRSVARGGRYDGVGAAFGAPRAATGFDVNLKRLPRVVESRRAIWAPALEATPAARRAALAAMVDALRESGERVVSAVVDRESPAVECDRELVWKRDGWNVQPRE